MKLLFDIIQIFLFLLFSLNEERAYSSVPK